MSLYLAIDAGGTKAEYVLADQEKRLAHTVGGTIKRMRVSAEEAATNLAEALAELEQQAGLPLAGVTATCIGTAGNSVKLVTDWLQQELYARVGGQLRIVGDVDIALDAAFPGQPGVVAIVGTGSNVAGRSSTGSVTNAGGYGPVLSDQASGHRIGLQALRALFIALDEARPTNIQSALLAHWRLSSIDELVAYANSCSSSEYSALAPSVLACADSGDAVAQEVIEEEGRELAHLIELVSLRLKKIDGEAWKPRLAFSGGIVEHSERVRKAIVQAVCLKLPDVQVSSTFAWPIEGALWRARNSG